MPHLKVTAPVQLHCVLIQSLVNLKVLTEGLNTFPAERQCQCKIQCDQCIYCCNRLQQKIKIFPYNIAICILCIFLQILKQVCVSLKRYYQYLLLSLLKDKQVLQEVVLQDNFSFSFLLTFSLTGAIFATEPDFYWYLILWKVKCSHKAIIFLQHLVFFSKIELEVTGQKSFQAFKRFLTFLFHLHDGFKG